jgi:hypothetical protein
MLRHLIVDLAPYNQMWRARTTRHTGSASQSAIAHVLADYLWSQGIRPDTDTELPRRLKDTVSRAFSGASLSARTLTWFIDAFELADEHSAELWATRFGDVPGVREVHGHARPAISGWAVAHRTLSLSETHTIGIDGIPVSHHTNQVILATRPMTHYTYRFDAPGARIALLRGGRASAVEDEPENHIFRCDFELTRPLAPGEVAFLEYETTFAYDVAPEPEFRRAAYTRVESVQIAVQFHPLWLPTRLWWAEWAHHLDAEPVREEPVAVGADGLVQSFVGALEKATVGYRWTFNDV